VSPKSILGAFEQLVLLAVLQQSERAFALEVRREIERSAGRTVSRGAFYTTLDRMERKGLVAWDEIEPEEEARGRPLRRYRVTPEGIAALRESIGAVRSLSRGLGELLGPAQ
jgi:PadR family transcriptional regulator PadR